MELSYSRELNVKIAAHPIKTRAVFLKDLTTLVQEVDNVIELISRHVEPAGFWNLRDSAEWAPLEFHRKGKATNGPGYPNAELAFHDFRMYQEKQTTGSRQPSVLATEKSSVLRCIVVSH